MIRHLKWWNVQAVTNFLATPRPMSILADSADEAIEKAQKELDRDTTIQCRHQGKLTVLQIYFIAGVWPDNVKEEGCWTRRSYHLKNLVDETSLRKALH